MHIFVDQSISLCLWLCAYAILCAFTFKVSRDISIGKHPVSRTAASGRIHISEKQKAEKQKPIRSHAGSNNFYFLAI